MSPSSDTIFKGMDTSTVGITIDAIGSVNTTIGTRVKDVRKLGVTVFSCLLVVE